MAASSPLRPRKTPRQQRAAHTVEALLEAAAQVLEADGLDGYNTNAVARRAGASVGTLYQYFPGKDALTLALLLREDRLFHDAAAATVALTGFHAALNAFIDVAVRQQLSRPNLALLLDQQEARPEIRAALSGKYRFHDLLAEILCKPDAPARFQDPALLRLAADDLLALMRGMIDAAGERGERDAIHLAQRIGAAAFGYLAAAPG
jgi:AcrR family transcriptional regulator